jgi:hypothetical protein
MKRFITFLAIAFVAIGALSFSGCGKGFSKSELEKQVAASMNEYFKEEGRQSLALNIGAITGLLNDITDVQVKKVSLIKEDDNHYTGSATLHVAQVNSYFDKDHTFKINVVVDEDNFQWQIVY